MTTSAEQQTASFRRLTPTYRPRQALKTPPCQLGCANCGDIRGWIGAIAQRDKIGLSRRDAYERAWRIITEVNPFPATLGRICPHPCEDQCNRSTRDEPVAINALERFLGDWAIAEGLPLSRSTDVMWTESIGVIGAGPSGLSFGYQLARRGYRVTAYEARAQPGGMLRYGIPDYRLPPRVLDAEIARILDLGVGLELGRVVGRDVALEEVRRRHRAVYVAIGAQRGITLGIPGEPGGSVWTGIEYLARVNCGECIDVGKHVAVIGGGNTAIDAARTARRAGAKVTVLYRRSRDEMPATKYEIEDALAEGVEIAFLSAPAALERSASGKINELVAIRLRLGEADASGRPRPLPIAGSEFRLQVNTVIAAVSQAPNLDGFERLHTPSGWLPAEVTDDLLAGGDVVTAGIAGEAIIQGRRAAEALHARLRQLSATESLVDGRPSIRPDEVMLDYKPPQPRARGPRLSGVESVLNGAEEVVGTISEEQFQHEAERCCSCGSCFGCEQCSMFCTLQCFTKLTAVRPGTYFHLELSRCQECGKCIEVCPCGYLEQAG